MSPSFLPFDILSSVQGLTQPWWCSQVGLSQGAETGRGGGEEEAAEAAAPLCRGLRAICVLPAKPLILHGQVRALHLGSKGAGLKKPRDRCHHLQREPPPAVHLHRSSPSLTEGPMAQKVTHSGTCPLVCSWALSGAPGMGEESSGWGVR